MRFKKWDPMAGLRRFVIIVVCLTGLAFLGLVLPSALPGRLIAGPLLAFYRAGPSRLMIHHCPSHPACPAYAAQAVERYGLALGGLMAVDRLIHEGGRLKEGPWVMVRGEVKLDDPLEANTFWLPEKKAADR